MSENRLEFDHDPTISELFARSFALAWKNYRALLPIFVIAGIANSIVFTLITLSTPSVNVPQNVQGISTQQALSIAGQAFTAAGYVYASYLVSMFILYFAAGVALHKLHNKLKPSEAPANLNLARVGATTLLATIIIFLSIFLAIVGAIIFGIMLYLSLAASVSEERSVFASLGRSKELASGRWIKTFFLMSGTLLFAFLVSYTIGGLAASISSSSYINNIIFLVVQNFVLALAFPPVSASMLLLYYSARARHEIITRAPPSPYDSLKPQPLGVPVDVTTGRFCRSCGTPLKQDERFCHNCGAPQNL